MLGIGWTEMLLIGVVALIVIGPKDLPVVMNRLGKAVSAIRRMGSEFQREVNKATGLDAVTDLRRSITEPLKQTAAEIRKEFNKPLANGSVVPSGIIAPKDPEAESVVNEIHAGVGLPAPSKPAAKTKKAKPVESPAPVEAIAPVEAASVKAIPAKTSPAKAVRKPRAKVAAPAPAEALPPKSARPRKPRAAKPKPVA